MPTRWRRRPAVVVSEGSTGLCLTVELDDVDAAFEKAKADGIAIEFEPLDEPWGDRHFAVLDPNGIPVDFVQHTPPQAS